jgi:hypothetical protein
VAFFVAIPGKTVNMSPGIMLLDKTPKEASPVTHARWLPFLAVAPALALFWLGGPALAGPGDKKIEFMREKGEFTADTPRDKIKKDCPCRIYALKCVEGRTYTIDMRSLDFDAFLRLEDAGGAKIDEDDDGGGGTDARIIFKAPKTATYSICATSFNADAKGKYTLSVDHDGKGVDLAINYLIDVKSKLTKEDKKDPTRGGNCYTKTYKIEMKPKTTYVIELDSKDFDAYIRLENQEDKQVAYDDDGAKVGLNAKLVYPCDKSGTYTIFATSFNEAALGEFSLRVSSFETKETKKETKKK